MTPGTPLCCAELYTKFVPAQKQKRNRHDSHSNCDSNATLDSNGKKIAASHFKFEKFMKKRLNKALLLLKFKIKYKVRGELGLINTRSKTQLRLFFECPIFVRYKNM